MKKFASLSILAAGLLTAFTAHAFEPKRPECIAPAKPGGGFDLTCRIVSNGFADAGLQKSPMAVKFMPGGVGAVAYAHITANRRNDPDALVAFSSGSLLNLAQGKWGNTDENAVRWVGAAGVDYGAIVVKADAPWKTLDELIADIRKDPSSFVLGAGGGVGSQDWMKAALLMKAAGIDPKAMRYVAYEGGGEATAALLGEHIKVYPADVGEMKGQLDAGTMRILAVMSDERLEGAFSKFPTAKEQGYDVQWPIMRGYYVGPEVSDEAYNYWVGQFNAAYQNPAFMKVVEEKGLLPLKLAGPAFDKRVKDSVAKMRDLAKEAGLTK